MKIVVLGVSGFLGNATSRALAASGHEVVGISRQRPTEPDARISYLETCYDVEAATAKYLRDADVILHMAWDTTPSDSALRAELEVGANLVPLSRLLDTLQRLFCGRLIFISTGGALYGDQPRPDTREGSVALPSPATAESQAANPASYYGAAKGASELLLRAFANQSGTPLTILRPSNVYGPGQSPRKHFAVVPTLLAALQSGSPFPVRGDGSAERDYLYIDDFVACVEKCIDQAAGQETDSTLNVCFGASTSIRDLIATAESVTGIAARIEQQAKPATDVTSVRLSNVLAGEQLGWSAAVSLREGLARTWAWMQRNR